MIKAILNSVATAWIARDVERGDIPEGMTVPLTLLAARLPAPILVVGALGYGLYRLNIETRAHHAKDVTLKRRRSAPRKAPSTSARRGRGSTAQS